MEKKPLLNSITKVENTVVQKLNQGTNPIPPKAERFRMAFLVTFFPQKK